MKTIIHFPRPLIKSNSPVAILSQEQYESLVETLEVMSDQPLLRRIESALNNLRQGKFFRHDEVFHNHNRHK